ncbi:MAG TPA: HEAT repeat domain-containing protein [Gemmatimonadales bacterium]|jgi:HEAT repeat protein
MTPTATSTEQRLATLDAAGRGPEGAPVILAALEDEAPSVRERAIRLAARYLEPGVLSEMVADGRNAVRRNAGLNALERQGPYAVPHLVGLLRGRDSELVMFAVQSLARIGDASAGPAIMPLLGHADPNVAQAAIEAVGRLRVREAVPTLCWLLQGDLWLQLAAIAALGEIGEAEAVRPLLALVPDSVVAEPAVEALRRIAAPESLEPLLRRFPAIPERGLRDRLLLAIAVVLELHPDPAPAVARVRADLLADGEAIAKYLEPLLLASADEDSEEADDLLRAAATFVAAAGIESLLPALLFRLATDPNAAWIEGVFRRFPEWLAPQLRDLLDHAEPEVRCGALRAGSFDEVDYPVIRSHLGDADPVVRAAACVALGRIGVDAVAPLLLERLRLGEPVEQAAAALALGDLSPAALGELDSLLRPDADQTAMVQALGILARRPVAALEPRVIELTESRTPAVRMAALRAVAQLAGSRSDVLLLRALADREQTIQREALEILVRRGGETSVSTLVALLGTTDSLRFHVIRALGQCRAASAATRLRDLYNECGPLEQVQIVRSLLRIGPSWLAEFLIQRLRDSDLEIRRTAAQGLSEIAVPDLLPVLRSLADDADWNIRNEAARGLGRFPTQETRATLLTLARDVEGVVAATARAALDRWPRDASPTAV